MQRWGRATADFARRHNPVNAIHHVKGWRPFHRDQAVLYVDEATSTKGEEDEESMLSQVEGSVGHLVMYLMPQVFIVAIFRKAQQVLVCEQLVQYRIQSVQCIHCSSLDGPMIRQGLVLVQTAELATFPWLGSLHVCCLVACRLCGGLGLMRKG